MGCITMKARRDVLTDMRREIKTWAKTHTIEDAKMLVEELESLGKDVRDLETIVNELEQIARDVEEWQKLHAPEIENFQVIKEEEVQAQAN